MDGLSGGGSHWYILNTKRVRVEILRQTISFIQMELARSKQTIAMIDIKETWVSLVQLLKIGLFEKVGFQKVRYEKVLFKKLSVW